MRRYPGSTQDQAVRAFGDGTLPGPNDIVVFLDPNEACDPNWFKKYGDCLVFGDPQSRAWGQVFMDTIAASPENSLSSLVKAG